MSFTDYIYVTVQNLKSSLQAGLNAFFDAQKDGQIEYSKQAFSKGRLPATARPDAYSGSNLPCVPPLCAVDNVGGDLTGRILTLHP